MQEFLDEVKSLWEAKAVVDARKEALSEASEKFEALKAGVLKKMELLELDKQHIPGMGTVYRQRNFSVKVPKSVDAKQRLFSWISSHKGVDVLDTMVSINSQTLNAFYKAELELAKERGDIDFALPGIDMPEVYWTIGMRK